uniref:Mid2 domain-containing protein n=1 Tax=Caenorhabditis tropicalis TaxID=1561998 RepID=A0A1I7TM24_9PELO
MNRQRFLFLALFLLPVYWCFDGILLTTIQVHSDVGIITCGKSLNLTIDAVKETPLCENEVQIANNAIVTFTYNSTAAFDGFKNISFLLEATVSDINGSISETNNYTGTYMFDEKSVANKVSVATLTLNKVAPPPPPPTTTTTKKTKKAEKEEGEVVQIEQFDGITSTEVHLTINYVHLKYDDSGKKVVENNGGAVAVAIIEGIALIAILAYMGYRTMVKHRMKETTMNAAMYGYDNNSRITVPDSIRMSDIPPPRDPTYATPPTPSTLQSPTRNTVMTTQELVVPTSTAASTRPTTTNTEQFRDPFDTLENW